MKDAYREVYPDPATHPAVTWPVHNKDARKETQWAAEADERDRIDFVYYRPDAKFAPKRLQIMGPSSMISKSAVVEDQFIDKAEADRTRGRRMAQRPPGTLHHLRSAIPPIKS